MGAFDFVTEELGSALDYKRKRRKPAPRLWFAGIDPGKKGFVSIVDLTDRPSVILSEPMAVLDSGKGPNYDLPGMWRLIQRLQAESVVGVVLEQQHAYPGQGVTSVFGLGYAYGMLSAMLTAAEVPFEIVHSSRWKKEMKIKGQGDDPKARKKDGKRRSISTCQGLYPDVDLRPTARARTPSNDKAESLLLATYAGRHLVWN